MTKFNRVLVYFTFLLILLPGCDTGRSEDQVIKSAGEIDLSAWNPASHGIINLDGQWEFYRMRLIEPSEFLKFLPCRSYISVPGVWNSRTDGGFKASGDGYATYRLMLKNIKPGSYSLKIPSMATAYKLWIESEAVASNGTVDTGDRMVPQQKPSVAFFSTGGGHIQVTVQVSNYMSDKGGLWGSIYLGTPEQIVVKRERAVALELMLFGSILIMSLYHFSLYAFRRGSRFTLYFGIVCFIVAVRIIFTGEFFIISLFPGFNWEVELKFEFLTIYLGFTAFVLFLHSLFPEEISDKTVRIFTVLCVIFSAITLLTKVKVYAEFMPLYHAAVVCGLIYIIYALAKGIAGGRDAAAHILAGCIILILAVINDILDANGIIHTGYFLPYGLFIFIFSQSVILSKLFSESFRKVEVLSEDLRISHARIEEHSRDLEIRISERTDDLRRANDKLIALDRARSDFVANVSHELRTPLTLVLNPVELILQGKYGEEINREHRVFNIMRRNGENLMKLINNMLDFSRIEAGKLQPLNEPCNISRFLRLVLSGFESVALSKGITLIFEDHISGLTALIDRGLVETVVYNLLSNALKFTPAGGTVVLSACLTGDGFSVTVSDTGIGIDESDIERIFDRFTQTDSSSSRRYEGAGIGLALVKEITALLGGTIRAESRPGEGASFTLSLPALRAELNNPSDSPHAEDDPVIYIPLSPAAGEAGDLNPDQQCCAEDDNDLTILIVEDNSDMRSFIVEMLAGKFNLIPAADGIAALELLDKIEPVDLILSDIMMPGMDGYELLKRIRSDENYEGVPFIFLTALAEREMIIEGLKLGAVDYITKPFSPDELVMRICSQLELKKMRNRLMRINKKLINGIGSSVNRRVSISGNMEQRLDMVCSFIRENFYDDITREFISRSLGMNPDTFSRMFNAHTGMGLSDYINNCRVVAAAKRLSETDDTVTRICMDTGFDCIRTFNRVFRKYKGMSPVEYRDISRLRN